MCVCVCLCVCVCVCVCVFVCVFCHVYCEIKRKLYTPFAMREFSVFKFSGYNLKNMKKILWKYSIQILKTADSILLSPVHER